MPFTVSYDVAPLLRLFVHRALLKGHNERLLIDAKSSLYRPAFVRPMNEKLRPLLSVPADIQTYSGWKSVMVVCRYKYTISCMKAIYALADSALKVIS